MKNSKEYSKKIQNLYRSLKRTYPKVSGKTADSTAAAGNQDIVQTLVCGIVSEKLSEPDTEAVMKRFAEYFVDLNDMRISRTEEIAEMLGANASQFPELPSAIQNCLTAIFNQYHKVSLDALKKLGKRQAKAVLEKIQGLNCFVIDYCILVSLGGHTIPLTDNMITYLKNNKLVAPEADAAEIAGFLTKQISAKNGYEFYCLLRKESEAPCLAETHTNAIQDDTKKHVPTKRGSRGKSGTKKTAASEKTKRESSKRKTASKKENVV